MEDRTYRRVRIGVVGVGVMGSCHVRDLADMQDADIIGVCDIDREKADRSAKQYGCKAFYSYQELLDAGIDAVVIATPHYDHTAITIDAFARGIHVLVEKPVAVHGNDAKKMNAAYEAARKKDPSLVYEVMFMMRTSPEYRKIKELIAGGELGRLVRTTWIITWWFRSQAYYNSGGWRATWRGEGGGVLMNQSPHNLDLYQWLVGMPSRVTGFVSLGKYHDIEVEDEATAYFEHENGMIGHFITTTAEAPGTNRLEIVGENGKLVFEHGKIKLYRNRISMLRHIKESATTWEVPEVWEIDVPVSTMSKGMHRVVLEDFCSAILSKHPPMNPGTEGINMVTLNNAIMLSSFSKRPIDIPFDGDEYEAKLRELSAGSRYKNNVTAVETKLPGGFK
ncbi:MAG: Gfo/Idh/MocA family oxidoreductase [Spirochaetota bacterium]